MNPLNASQSTVCRLAWKRYSRQTQLRDVAPALNGRASLARVRPCRTGAASFMVARAGTRTSSTRCVTPNCPRIGSRTSGAEVLEIRVLHPSLAQRLVREVVHMLEGEIAPPASPCGSGG